MIRFVRDWPVSGRTTKITMSFPEEPKASDIIFSFDNFEGNIDDLDEFILFDNADLKAKRESVIDSLLRELDNCQGGTS